MITKYSAVTSTASSGSPAAAAIPIAAVSHTEAALFGPRMAPCPEGEREQQLPDLAPALAVQNHRRGDTHRELPAGGPAGTRVVTVVIAAQAVQPNRAVVVVQPA